MKTINGNINMYQNNYISLGQVIQNDTVLLNITINDLTGNPNKATLIQKMEDGTTIQITSVVVNGKKVTATIPTAFCIGLVENQLIFTNGSQTTTTKFYYYVNRKIDIDDGTITPDVPQIDLSNYATTEYVDKVFNFFTVEIEDAETSTIAERTVAAVRQKWIDLIEENKITREYSTVNYSKDIVVKVNVADVPVPIFVTLNYTTAEQYLDGYIVYGEDEIRNDRPDGEEWTDWMSIYANIPPLDATVNIIERDREVAIIPSLGVSSVSNNKYHRSASAEYARIRRFPIVDTTKLAEKNHTHAEYATQEDLDNYAEKDHVHPEYIPAESAQNFVFRNELSDYAEKNHTHAEYMTEEEVLNIVQNNAPSVDTSNLVTRNELNGYSTIDHTHAEYVTEEEVLNIVQNNAPSVDHTHDYAKIHRCTQDEYIAITTKDPNTLYIIT